jgi:hypothetical protein
LGHEGKRTLSHHVSGGLKGSSLSAATSRHPFLTIFYFVLRVWDNHAHFHKDHQVKPALEMNANSSMPNIVSISWEATDPLFDPT